MRRKHFFEWEDQKWFPHLLRGYMTDFLNFTMNLTSWPFEGVIRKLQQTLERAGTRHIIDLCSGSGGPIPIFVRRIREQGLEVKATLTDYYPNIGKFEQINRENPGISYLAESVDASAVPSRLHGLRTIFNGFHHLEPFRARNVLQDAMQAKQPIAIFEFMDRTPAAFFSLAFMIATIPVLTPFMRPFQLSRLILTYPIPAIPFFCFWDGLVSCFRIYSEDELRELVSDLNDPDYAWEIGKVPLNGGAGAATYITGLPSRSRI
jgi:hypothetical protein